MIDKGLQAFLIALTISGLVAPIVFRVLVKAKSRQTVSEYVPEHAAKQGTPTMGGLITLIGIMAALAITEAQASIGAFLLLVGFGLIGYVDDFIVPRMLEGKRGLGWKQKLIFQVIIAISVYPLSGHNQPLSILAGVFMVLLFSNAYNFSDGLDALAASLGLLIAAGLALGVVIHQDLPSHVNTVMWALAGGLLPFLYLNRYPARLFMGDVGALPIGALIGYAVSQQLLRTSGGIRTEMILPLLVLSIVMIVELVPVPLQIASVKLRKGKRLFPRTPIHHAFQHAGWKETKVVWMFVLVQAALVGCYLLLIAMATKKI